MERGSSPQVSTLEIIADTRYLSFVGDLGPARKTYISTLHLSYIHSVDGRLL